MFDWFEIMFFKTFCPHQQAMIIPKQISHFNEDKEPFVFVSFIASEQHVRPGAIHSTSQTTRKSSTSFFKTKKKNTRKLGKLDLKLFVLLKSKLLAALFLRKMTFGISLSNPADLALKHPFMLA